MVQQDDSFIREVNDELRSDQVRLVWSRFRGVIIGIAILIVLGTIGKVGYDYWDESSASASGDSFLTAMRLAGENKPDEALAQLTALEKDGYGSYPLLARMRAATILQQKGDAAGAARAFSEIGKDGSVNEAVRDAAKLRAAYILVDTGSYADVSAEVEAFAVPENGMRHSAREALGLAAYKAGDFAKARDWFQTITNDVQSPSNISNRAQIMLDLIAASGKAA